MNQNPGDETQVSKNVQTEVPGQESSASAAKDPGASSDRTASGNSSKARWMAMAAGLAVLLLLGALGWYIARGANEVRTVKIGVDSQFTGSEEPIKTGVELAQRHFAADNIKVTIVPIDTECDGEKATKAAKDWSAQGVVAVIGNVCSGAMLEAAKTITGLKLTYVSPSATNADVSKASDYIFRTIPSDAFAADSTGEYLYDTLNARKLAIFYGDDEYGEGLKNDVAANFEKRGGKTVSAQSFESEATEISAQVQQVVAAKPDSIYIATTSTSTALLILQKLKAQGITVPVVGSETLKDITNFDEYSAAEGLIVVGANNGSAKFLSDFKAAYGKEPGTYSAQAYDAYGAIFKALQAGAKTGEEIKNGLYKVSFTGASGKIAFNKDGDVAANYTIYKLTDEGWVAQ